MEKIVMNRTELAELFQVAKTTIDSWVKAGMPCEGGGGKGNPRLFDVAAAVKWQLQQIEEEPVKNSVYTELIEKEKLRKLKRENDAADKLYAPVELFETALERAKEVVIPILETLPAILKRNCPDLPAGAYALADKAVADCREVILNMQIDFD